MIMYKFGFCGVEHRLIYGRNQIMFFSYRSFENTGCHVTCVLFHPSINRKIIYNLHTQTGSTISNDQSQDETHQNTPRKINVVPENHPVEKDNHLPTIIFRFHVRCTHHNAQHPMTQYPSNTIPMDNFLITITNEWKFFLKDHWR